MSSKIYFYLIVVSVAFNLLLPKNTNAQISINSSGNAPHASAGLDVDFTNRGVLIPRLSQAQRDAINNPANSLLIYQTDNTPGFYYWNGSQWVMLGLSNHTHSTLTFNNSGTGSSSGSIYNGSSALIVSYNTIGAVGGSGTATQVAFWNNTNTLSSSANLFWDNSNIRLGVGTSSPLARIHATGEIFSTSSYGDIVYIGGDNAGNDAEIGIQSSSRNTITFYNRTQGINADINIRDILSARHITFSGALMPNGNAGNAGQVLVSQGSGNPPTWANLTGGLVNFINPHTVLNGFTGTHGPNSGNCLRWQDYHSYCGCGYYYDWEYGCYTSEVTYNTGCPCTYYDGYPNNTTGYSWQTANLSGIVPAGTKQVLVQVHWAISSPDYDDVDAFLLVRKNSSSPTYAIARGRSSGSGDNVAGALQAIIPIDETNLTFQYAVERPGFNGGITLQVIGYY